MGSVNTESKVYTKSKLISVQVEVWSILWTVLRTIITGRNMSLDYHFFSFWPDTWIDWRQELVSSIKYEIRRFSVECIAVCFQYDNFLMLYRKTDKIFFA